MIIEKRTENSARLNNQLKGVGRKFLGSLNNIGFCSLHSALISYFPIRAFSIDYFNCSNFKGEVDSTHIARSLPIPLNQLKI